MQNPFKHFKSFMERQDVYMILLIILVGGASFGIGRLSTQNAPTTSQVRIENVFPTTTPMLPIEQGGDTEITEVTQSGVFVGSINSDKYHYPWCSGAQRIKEENKIWFATREDAEAAGYTPAANCQGL